MPNTVKKEKQVLKLLLRGILVLSIVMVLVLGLAGTVAAAPPERIKGDMFICPSVSPNNPNGMWLIGGSGAYYVIFPGTKSDNWDPSLNPFQAVEDNPADVEAQAQVKAGKGLYGKLGDYFSGMAMVLPDDGQEFIFDTYGLVVPPGPITVVPSDDPPSYAGGTLDANVLMKSAVFW